MNLWTGFGNLGGDPELKYTPQGVEVCTFSMATTEKWTDAQGAKKEETQWHRIVCWRGLAKVCAEYLSKGSKVLVSGKLTNRSYEDSAGVKKYISEIQARSVEFVSANAKKETGAPAARSGPAASPADDDISF